MAYIEVTAICCSCNTWGTVFVTGPVNINYLGHNARKKFHMRGWSADHQGRWICPECHQTKEGAE